MRHRTAAPTPPIVPGGTAGRHDSFFTRGGKVGGLVEARVTSGSPSLIGPKDSAYAHRASMFSLIHEPVLDATVANVLTAASTGNARPEARGVGNSVFMVEV